MQIVSQRDSLHEMSKPIFWEKKRKIPFICHLLKLLREWSRLNLLKWPLSCLPTGVPGVKSERFEEGLQPQHCALSLVGEPIMYPEINRFVDLLHEKGISTFLVTNAQFPDAIR